MFRLNNIQEFNELQNRMKTPSGTRITSALPAFSQQSTNKHNNVICEADKIKFRSKKERKRYLELCALRDAGECWFLRQVAFHLPGNTKYVIDFIIFWKDGKPTFEDVKGMRTPMFIMKKKQVEALYPIKIIES